VHLVTGGAATVSYIPSLRPSTHHAVMAAGHVPIPGVWGVCSLPAARNLYQAHSIGFVLICR